MMRSPFLILAVLLLASRGPLHAAHKPNIIIIFADDLGYGDLGCYGSTKNRTPALDKMAREGMKLTSFYVTSGVCSPSRASLMTGCYPLRVGLHESSRGCFVLVPGDHRGMNPSEMTIPRLLKQQGYATMIIGKWHLGDQPPFFPRQYGFVEELDWSTGEIMSALKRLGLDENTLVVFTSDNGAIGRGSNQPLSGGKATTMEGGMREPCLVHWPGKVPAGAICDEVASTIDLLPTLARLAGGAVPTDRAIDGKDIADLILGKPGSRSPHEEGFYYYFMSQLQAIRLGKWKLRLPLDPEIGGWTGQPKGKSEARLYDLEADIGEKHNVATEHPDVAAKLTALAEKARQEIGDAFANAMTRMIKWR